MSKIINLDWHRKAQEMPWISCGCGEQKWFVMMDPAIASRQVVAVRCGSCGQQFQLDTPGVLPKLVKNDKDPAGS